MKKIRTTKHAANRFNERIDENGKVKEAARLAYKNGRTAKHFTGTLKQFIIDKSSGGNRARVVVYRGSVYVFGKNENDGRTYLITTYRLPDDMMKEYLKQIQIKNECRENEYKKTLYEIKEKGGIVCGADFEKMKEACTKAHKYDQIMRTLKESGKESIYEKEELYLQSEEKLS